MENKEKVIEIIKKLFALAEKNTNEAESKKAMLKAQKMLAKYGLTMGEIGDLGIQEEVEIKDITEKTKTSTFIKGLANTVANNFRCKCVVSHNGWGKTCIQYIGFPTDIEIATSVFKFAKVQAEYHAKEYVNRAKKEGTYTRGTKTAFLLGYVRGLYEAFEEQKVQDNALALVVQTPQEVMDKLNSMRTRNTSLRTNTLSQNESHFNNGMEKGKQFKNVSGLVNA